MGRGRNKGIGTLSLSAASGPIPCYLSVCLSCRLALGGLGALVTRCHWAETPSVGHKATFLSSRRCRSPSGPSPGSHVHSLYWEHFGARGSTGHVEREDAWPPNRRCPRRCPVPKGAKPGSCPHPPCSPARHLHHGVRKQRRRGSQFAPCISPTPAWSQSYLDGEKCCIFTNPLCLAALTSWVELAFAPRPLAASLPALLSLMPAHSPKAGRASSLEALGPCRGPGPRSHHRKCSPSPILSPPMTQRPHLAFSPILNLDPSRHFGASPWLQLCCPARFIAE